MSGDEIHGGEIRPPERDDDGDGDGDFLHGVTFVGPQWKYKGGGWGGFLSAMGENKAWSMKSEPLEMAALWFC